MLLVAVERRWSRAPRGVLAADVLQVRRLRNSRVARTSPPTRRWRVTQPFLGDRRGRRRPGGEIIAMSASSTATRRWSATPPATRPAHRPRSIRTSTSAWASACRSTPIPVTPPGAAAQCRPRGVGQGSVAGFTAYIQQNPAAIGLSTDSGHGTADSGSGDAWGYVQGLRPNYGKSRTGAAAARIARPSC